MGNLKFFCGKMALARLSLLACFATQSSAYVAPAHGEVRAAGARPWVSEPAMKMVENRAEVDGEASAGSFGVVAASVAAVAALGWLSQRRQQLATAAAAAAVAVA